MTKSIQTQIGELVNETNDNAMCIRSLTSLFFKHKDLPVKDLARLMMAIEMQATTILANGLVAEKLPINGRDDKNLTEVRHCLQYDNGDFVALDQASGGYPYGVSIDRAHDFRSEQKALAYPSSSEHFTYVEVQAKFEVV